MVPGRAPQKGLELLASRGQAGGDGLVGHPKGGRDLAVGVSVEVPEDKRGGLLGGELVQRPDQV